MKVLLVYYFDNTIIDDNRDTRIVQCAPDKKIPTEMQDSYHKVIWTKLMGRAFKYLGEKGVKEDEMRRADINAFHFRDGRAFQLSRDE